jgi:hypothetical protein
MAYQELYNEYIALLGDKATCHKALATLKAGYISIKTIAGKKYAYLQYRVDGKLLCEYIRKDDLANIRVELAERARVLEKMRDIDARLKKIEAAAAILDNSLSRKMLTLRRCAIMEALPFAERKKSLAFGRAITALEGVAASAETEKNLYNWAKGEASFQESYLRTLRAYHLAEV